jgi:hypothetical protein
LAESKSLTGVQDQNHPIRARYTLFNSVGTISVIFTQEPATIKKVEKAEHIGRYYHF